MTRQFVRVRDRVVEVRGQIRDGKLLLEAPVERIWSVLQEGPRIILVEDHRRVPLWVSRDDRGGIWVSFQGQVYRLEIAPPQSPHASTEKPREILSPLTGKVQRIHVREGERVEEGTTLVTVEAMKMEYHLTAPAPALVETVTVKEGDLVDLGQVLVRLSYPPADHLQPGGERGDIPEE